MKKILFLLVILVMSVTMLYADVPKTINYQGRLTDLSGNAVTDKTYTLTISLYTAVDATSAVWTGIYSAETKNGYFNITLGTGPSYPLTSLRFDQQYYVGIKVEGDNEMTPRQPLASTPYALNVPDAAVTNAKIADGAVTEGKLSFSDATTGNVSTSAHGLVPKAPNDTTMFLRGDASWQTFPGYQLANVVVYTSNATYTPSSGTRAIVVELVGGGGGGGGAASSGGGSSGACGGGGGGYIKKLLMPGSTTSFAVVVGAGGSGGVAGENSGSAGGKTQFGSALYADGGNGGAGSASSSVARVYYYGGSGGSGANGNFAVTGGTGDCGFQVAVDSPIGGRGGASMYSPGARNSFNGPGSIPVGYGGGGGGASAIANTNQAGGAGSAGIVIIWEYK